MWEARMVAAIALTAAAFMLRFLVALLREGAPAVCYWVVAAQCNQEPDARIANCDASECNRNVRWPELLVEKQDYAKEVRPSGLMRIDIRSVPNGLGWRSIRKGIDVLRERHI